MLAQHGFDMSNVGEYFRTYRDRHQVSQTKLAETLQVQYPYVANTETGKIKSPKALIIRLYKILNDDERVELVEAIKADTIAEMNAFIKEMEGE